MPTLWGRNYQLQELQAHWDLVYAAIDSVLGNTFTQLPFGDPRFGLPTATTFTGRRKHTDGLTPTWTWSEAPASFDAPLDLTSPDSFQGIIPVVEFNGTDEEADTDDNAYWTRDDAGGANGFSVMVWAKISSSGSGTRNFISKRNDAGSTQEWTFQIRDNEILRLSLYDQSAGVSPYRASDVAITQDIWVCLVATYDGTGGATAASGITQYVNGAVRASTANEQGTYVGMENLGSKVSLAMEPNAARFFQGQLAGGPCGIIWEQAEWTAAQAKLLYDYTRGALGV
jgi:hypothetical protein